jgi:hypothetical protein
MTIAPRTDAETGNKILANHVLDPEAAPVEIAVTVTDRRVRASSPIAGSSITPTLDSSDARPPVAIARAREALLDDARRLLALPRLGDARSVWRAALPSLDIDRSGDSASIEVFSFRGSTIAVLFHDEQATAIRLPYAWFRLHHFVYPQPAAAEQTAGVGGPRILAADSGWMVATDQCDLPALRLLAAVKGAASPD